MSGLLSLQGSSDHCQWHLESEGSSPYKDKSDLLHPQCPNTSPSALPLCLCTCCFLWTTLHSWSSPPVWTPWQSQSHIPALHRVPQLLVLPASPMLLRPLQNVQLPRLATVWAEAGGCVGTGFGCFMHTLSLKPHNLEGRHDSHCCFIDEEGCSERSSHLTEVTQPAKGERWIRSWESVCKACN